MIQKLVFLLLVWLALGETASAKTLCVLKDGWELPSGCSGSYYGIIQNAITDADDGDTVKIGPGVWDETVYVTKPIVVLGTNFPQTIIHPKQGEGMVILNGFVSCLNIKSETHHGVIIFKGAIKNCIIEGCSDYYNVNCGGVRYIGVTSTVANCVIQWSGYHGVYGRDKNTFLLFYNNVLYNNWHQAGYTYDEAAVKYNFNCYWQNEVDGWGCLAGVFKGDSDLVANPMFLDAALLPIRDLSPLINRGDTAVFNPDGSRSDIGAYGGPDSCTCSVLVGVEDSQTPELKITITPNPATDLAIINYQLPSDCPVTVTISDCLGQIVATPLQNQWQATGNRQINFALNGLPSGAYLCTIKTSFTTATNKFAVIR